jgi:hypothetical protein
MPVFDNIPVKLLNTALPDLPRRLLPPVSVDNRL